MASVPGLDAAQVSKAAMALMGYLRKKHGAAGGQLLDEEEVIWLSMTFKKTPNYARHPKRIALPHGLYSTPTTQICLLTKDPGSEYEQLLKSKNVPGNITVLGVSKLKAEYKPYEAKRQLCNMYDMFLADERILPVLPRLLGKDFYQKKKLPRGVNLKKQDVTGEIAKARDAAYLHLGTGPTSALRIGHSGMTVEQITENVLRAMEQVVVHVPGNAKGIQVLHMRSTDSAALPIYNSLPVYEDNDDVVVPPVERKRKNVDTDGTPQKRFKKSKKTTDAAQPKEETLVQAVPDRAENALDNAADSEKELKKKKKRKKDVASPVVPPTAVVVETPPKSSKRKVEAKDEDAGPPKKTAKLEAKAIKTPAKVSNQKVAKVIEAPAETEPEAQLVEKRATKPGAKTPASRKAETLATDPPVKTAAKKQTKTLAKTPAETPAETPLKTPLKTPAKKQTKTPAETPAETPVKTPLKTPAKKQTEMPAKTPSKTLSKTPTGEGQLAVPQPTTDTPRPARKRKMAESEGRNADKRK